MSTSPNKRSRRACKTSLNLPYSSALDLCAFLGLVREELGLPLKFLATLRTVPVAAACAPPLVLPEVNRRLAELVCLAAEARLLATMEETVLGPELFLATACLCGLLVLDAPRLVVGDLPLAAFLRCRLLQPSLLGNGFRSRRFLGGRGGSDFVVGRLGTDALTLGVLVFLTPPLADLRGLLLDFAAGADFLEVARALDAVDTVLEDALAVFFFGLKELPSQLRGFGVVEW